MTWFSEKNTCQKHRSNKWQGWSLHIDQAALIRMKLKVTVSSKRFEDSNGDEMWAGRSKSQFLLWFQTNLAGSHKMSRQRNNDRRSERIEKKHDACLEIANITSRENISDCRTHLRLQTNQLVANRTFQKWVETPDASVLWTLSVTSLRQSESPFANADKAFQTPLRFCPAI
jgi:hypothetical protein